MPSVGEPDGIPTLQGSQGYSSTAGTPQLRRLHHPGRQQFPHPRHTDARRPPSFTQACCSAVGLAVLQHGPPAAMSVPPRPANVTEYDGLGLWYGDNNPSSTRSHYQDRDNSNNNDNDNDRKKKRKKKVKIIMIMLMAVIMIIMIIVRKRNWMWW